MVDMAPCVTLNDTPNIVSQIVFRDCHMGFDVPVGDAIWGQVGQMQQQNAFVVHLQEMLLHISFWWTNYIMPRGKYNFHTQIHPVENFCVY